MKCHLHHVQCVAPGQFQATWLVVSGGPNERVLIFDGDSTAVMWGNSGPVMHAEPVRVDVAAKMVNLIHLGIAPAETDDPEMQPQGVRVLTDAEFEAFCNAPRLTFESGVQ